MPPITLRTAAPAARVQADAARRTISGLVVPWESYAVVSTGQNISFARGSVQLGERTKLVLDHDPGRPVAVYASSSDTAAGLEATWRVPEGAAGDAVLAEAGSGLRDGLSLAADLDDVSETAEGLYVRAAHGRHVALLSEPAFDAARVSTVTATAPGGTMPPEPITAPVVTPPVPPAGVAGSPPEPPQVAAGGIVPTAAGLAAGGPTVPAPVRVRDPYPYAQPLELGGPSFVRDALASEDQPGSEGAERWRRAQMIAADPAYIRAGLSRFGRVLHSAPDAEVMAAPSTTVTDPALVPPRWLPGRYVPLRGAKAPLWTAITKLGTPDFNTLEVPRTATEAGLAGVPPDEVTPIAPGTLTTTNDTITINEVEGAYLLSRKLLLGSNPQIDRIALDAMDRAWLAEVESEAVTYFVGGANVHTAVNATYADGLGYIAAVRAQFAALAAATLYQATDVIPASKEYIAAAEADDTTGRPMLPYGPQVNASGESAAGYASVSIQGVPLLPGPYMSANHTLILDQSLDAAVAFATPIMDFRLEWTTDATTGGNVKVLKLVKYSGVGFWAQYPGGIVLMTNTTPIATANGNGGAAPAAGASKRA